MNWIKSLSTQRAPGCFVLVIVWGFMAMVLCGGYLTVQEQLGILTGSQRVTGTITATENRAETNGESQYILVYEYDAGYGDPPDVYTGRQRVTSDVFKRFAKGDTVEVYFRPDARGTSMILPVEEFTSMLGVALACGIPFLLTSGLLLAAVWKRMRGQDEDKQKIGLS